MNSIPYQGGHQARTARVSTQLAILLSVTIVSFVVIGVMTWRTLEVLKVNGPIYAKIVDGKDVVADILPPPMFIVEANLLAHQMARGVRWLGSNIARSFKHPRKECQRWGCGFLGNGVKGAP